ncbi:hypothetical protein JCM1393_05230 [Clostridium carnis]
MYKTFINTYKVSFAESVNVFIFYLKGIPFIGKIFSENLYKATKGKIIIGTIVTIFNFLLGFIKKGLYILAMIILPVYWLEKTTGLTNIQDAKINVLFFLSFIFGTFINIKIMENNKEDFNMIRLMRVDPKKYYIGKLICLILQNFISFLPAIIIVFNIPFKYALSLNQSIILTIELVAFKIIGEWFNFYFYNKTSINLIKKSSVTVTIMFLSVALAYGLPVINLVHGLQDFKITINLGQILFNNIFFISVVTLGILSFIYFYFYDRYTEFANKIVKLETLVNTEEIMKEATFKNVKLDEKNFSKENLNSHIFENKSGYDYLNSIFFLRHRKIIEKPIQIRVLGTFAIAAIIIIVMFIFPEIKKDIGEGLTKNTAIWVFIMYSLSTTDRVCKAMFHNCDVSLLRYEYYREGTVILSNFKVRLKKLVLLSLFPAMAIDLSLVIILIISGETNNIVNIIPILISIICLSAFFSIHHLFLYYTIQPYTKQLTVQSPLFKIISGMVYMISYITLQIKTSSYYFTIGIIISTIVYMIVALIMTYKVAPKTFKLR